MRQRLLDTPADRIPAELAATVRAFCEPIDAINAAYVGLTELTVEFHDPREQLAVADRFYESMPEEVVAGGCNFLEPGGIDAWRAKAQQVFSRST